MDIFTKEELEEALRAISSAISKCEKAQPKLKQGTFQHTMTVRGIKAYYIAIELIKRESETNIKKNQLECKYTKEELEEARQTITSAISRIEKVQPKFKTDTSQYTLAKRRIKAFYIAIELIKNAMMKLTFLK